MVGATPEDRDPTGRAKRNRKTAAATPNKVVRALSGYRSDIRKRNVVRKKPVPRSNRAVGVFGARDRWAGAPSPGAGSAGRPTVPVVKLPITNVSSSMGGGAARVISGGRLARPQFGQRSQVGGPLALASSAA